MISYKTVISKWIVFLCFALVIVFPGYAWENYGEYSIPSDIQSVIHEIEMNSQKKCELSADQMEILTGFQNNLRRIVQLLTPSIVKIRVIKEVVYDYPVSYYYDHRGDDALNPPVVRLQESVGSGFIYSRNGYIVTNGHVIEDAREIWISFHHVSEHKAVVIGVDSQSDLAVLKTTFPDELSPVTFANSDSVSPGEFVLTAGNPFGLGISLSLGIVSGINRDIAPEIMDQQNVTRYIQTDASINMGNSGGPLVNAYGRVIGISTAIYSLSGENEGIGFAIPSNRIVRVVEDLINQGKVQRGYLGVGIIPITEGMIHQFQYTNSHGVFVEKVYDNSPAAAANIRPGDILVSLKDQSLASETDLYHLISQTRVGERVKIMIYRNHSLLETYAVIGNYENFNIYGSCREYQGVLYKNAFGMVFSNLAENPAITQWENTPEIGVVVLHLNEEGMAKKSGIQEGDILTKVDFLPTPSPEVLDQYFEENKRKTQFLIEYWREGQYNTLVLSK